LVIDVDSHRGEYGCRGGGCGHNHGECSGSYHTPLRGLLHLIILKSLSKNPMRGIELKKKIRDELELDIPSPAIYVVLKMLENKGLVVSNWEIDEKGSARKIYRITEEGLDYLNESLGRLKSLKKILEYLHS